jgi:hypothetical protein
MGACGKDPGQCVHDRIGQYILSLTQIYIINSLSSEFRDPVSQPSTLNFHRIFELLRLV